MPHAGRWRKVEAFVDGRLGFASATTPSPETRLSDTPIPPPAEIAAQAKFKPGEITRAEFEAVWARAIQANA